MSKRTSFFASRTFLFLLATFMCGWGIYSGPRLGDHECINAQCARETIEAGHWLIPRFDDQPRVRKSPLGVWLIAITSTVVDRFGGPQRVSELTARLPQAIAGVVNIFVLAWLGRRMFGARAGRLAGFMSAVTLATIYFSHSALIEMTLTMWIALAFACFWRACEDPGVNRKWLIGFYAAFGMAMMAKMPLPLMIIAPPLFIYWILIRPQTLQAADASETGYGENNASLPQGCIAQFKAIPKLLSIPGILVFLLICGAWPLYVYLNVEDVVSLWQAEYMGRFSGEMTERSMPAWYYIPLVFGFIFPFVLFLPEGIAGFFLKPYQRHRHALGFLLAWGAWGLFFLSLSSFKRPHYLASIIPPFLLMMVPVVDRLYFDALAYSKRTIQVFCDVYTIAIVVLAIVATLRLGKQEFVSPPVLYTAIGLVAICLGGAGVAFRLNRRTASLALLLLTGPVMVVAGWHGAERLDARDNRIEAVKLALDKAGVTEDDLVIQMDGRVDARFPFYANLSMQKLLTPLEVSQYRTSRKAMPPELLHAVVDRMRELVEAQPRTFFVVEADSYDYFKDKFTAPIFELDRVELAPDAGGKSYVVLSGQPRTETGTP